MTTLQDRHNLEVVVDNASELAATDPTAFAMIRRVGLGASDSSTLLGVNLYNTLPNLIEEKLSTTITDEELAIGKKANVRKGSDLEPLILDKFKAWSNADEFVKPSEMFRLKEHPQLTVNFDGVWTMDADLDIPVEAKLVGPYAAKFWDRTKAVDNPICGSAKICGGSGFVEHIEEEARLYGVPAYYYTQVQHQILALNAPFGYLVGLFDKEWEIKVYKIFNDKYTIDALIKQSEHTWETFQRKKGN